MLTSTLNILLALGLGGASAQMMMTGSAMPVSDPTCAQAMILAQGIALNIQDQQQELATANQLAMLLAAPQVDTQAYMAARTNLLRFVNNGIAIRQMNQLITPAENKATEGVAIVANAQLTELGLSTNLTMTGSDNLDANKQIVQMLQKNFAGGIQQNMKNMADAMSGCGTSTVSPAAAAPAPAPEMPAAAAAAAAGAAAPASQEAKPSGVAETASEPMAMMMNTTTMPAGTEKAAGSRKARFVLTNARIGVQNERPRP